MCCHRYKKTTETIESQSQPELLYESLQNYAASRRDDGSRSLLVEVAEAAMFQAEAERQPDDSTMVENNEKVTDGIELGLVAKKNFAAEAGAEGSQVGSPSRIDDRASKNHSGRPNGSE